MRLHEEPCVDFRVVATGLGIVTEHSLSPGWSPLAESTKDQN
jgi:hypothetical protein